jgi:serine/threonine protein kinase
MAGHPCRHKVLADIHSSDPDLRSRFVQEARLLRRIRSPHVVTVYDVGETDAAAGIVHRDIKPSNLLLQAPVQTGDAGSVVYADETILLGDLGLAKAAHHHARG